MHIIIHEKKCATKTILRGGLHCRKTSHRELLVALESGNPATYAHSMKSHFNGIHTRLDS